MVYFSTNFFVFSVYFSCLSQPSSADLISHKSCDTNVKFSQLKKAEIYEENKNVSVSKKKPYHYIQRGIMLKGIIVIEYLIQQWLMMDLVLLFLFQNTSV